MTLLNALQRTLAAAAALAVSACGQGGSGGDTIYTGGSIYTGLSEEARVEAILVRDGRIVSAGPLVDALGQTLFAEEIDIGDDAVMFPGFIRLGVDLVALGLEDRAPLSEPAQPARERAIVRAAEVLAIGGWTSIEAVNLSDGDRDLIETLTEDGKLPIRVLLSQGDDRELPLTHPTGASAFLTDVQQTRDETTETPARGVRERVGRDQTLAALTTAPATALGVDAQLGLVAPGYHADFSVFNTDLMTAPEVDLADAEPVMTVVGGVITWRADQSGR